MLIIMLYVCMYVREEFSREKCHNTCDNCAEQGCWEMCNYEEQGRLVLRVLEGLNSLGLKDLTLVQLKNLITNSKDKKLDRYRDGLEKNLIPVNVKHMVKEKMVVMSKDSCDVLLQVFISQSMMNRCALSFTYLCVSRLWWRINSLRKLHKLQ
jgi:hypothetical protein